jgi:hypothetical protein
MALDRWIGTRAFRPLIAKNLCQVVVKAGRFQMHPTDKARDKPQPHPVLLAHIFPKSHGRAAS